MENKQHTNLLINESSPYLLQHAHNPVNWYPWGEAALERAKNEDKPILVSIGYSACHWCHVMERESFEDESTAEIMNRYFINIKIDREERPDLDHIYMDAVQAIAGNGGWPLNVFLTPDKKPFFGGTYFPPVNAYNRSSWKNVLLNVHQLFAEKRNEVEAQAENLTQHLIDAVSINTSFSTNLGKDIFSKANESLIALNILSQADTLDGGFGKAPKFPQTFSLQYLLRHYHFTNDERALNQALLSLDKMIMGGIYDQLGGGFARYSTDKEWLAPHFEKMLYDNALLVSVISEAYQITGREYYAQTIKDTLEFVKREMQSEEFGFYSALDADSEGVEGKYYVWTKDEVQELLGENSPLFCTYYDVTHLGNWEEVNILRVKSKADDFAAHIGLTVEEFQKQLAASKKKLMTARDLRIRPQLDDKILLGWNALMITAYCKAFAAIGLEEYRETAINAIHFIETKMRDKEGGFYHTYKNDKATIGAFLDDYAYLIQSYIHLQEITGNQEYLNSAYRLVDYVLLNFKDTEQGYFCYTSLKQQDVILRKVEIYDGAIPSGNSIMVQNLLYLSLVFDKKEWKEMASNNLVSLIGMITKHPISFGNWASSFQLLINGQKELVLTGNNILEDLPKVLKEYIPNKVLQTTFLQLDEYPLLKGKVITESNAYYLCEDYHCHPVVNSVEELIELIVSKKKE